MTPNYQGSHQISSVRRSAGGEILMVLSRQTSARRNRAELNGPSSRCVLRITSECAYPLKHVGTLRPAAFTANRAPTAEALRIQLNVWYTFNTVELPALRHAVSWITSSRRRLLNVHRSPAGRAKHQQERVTELYSEWAPLVCTNDDRNETGAPLTPLSGFQWILGSHSSALYHGRL